MSEEKIEYVAETEPVFAPRYIGAGRPRLRPEKAGDYQKRRFLPTIDVELDKETGNTKIVITGKRDMEEEIQAAKENAGFDNMRRMLQSGQALPQDFADDGKHGVDLLGVPDNVHDAYQAKLEAERNAEEAAKNLGMEIPTDESKIQELVDARLQAILEGLQAKKAGNGEGDKE